MQTLYSLLLPAVLLSCMVQGNKLDCGQACQEALGYLTFAGTDADADYYTAQCANDLRVESIFICMRSYCSSSDLESGLKDYNSTCQTYGLISLPPYSVIDNITDAEVKTLMVIAVDEFMDTDVMENLVLTSEALYELSFKTVGTWNSSVTTRADYGYAMFGFWALVLAIGFLTRVMALLKSKKRPATGDVPKLHSPTKVQSWLQRYITTPALWSQHCAEPFGWCTIPPRLQSLTIIAYVIINFVLCFTSYHLFEGNLYWSSTRTQLSRYVADRTGVLAIANLPLLWAFAMRNNVLLWLTGWSFATFNQFHRWVARVATVEAVIHSVAYTVEAFQEGGKAEYVEDWAERYWWCGAMAIIAMCLLCALSVLPMRQYLYEIFLIVHIAFAVLTLVAMWYHVEIFDGEYNGYIWPCVAVWAFDRVLRIGQLVLLNFRLQKTTALYNPDSEIVRVEFETSLVTPRPGSYYYLYVLKGLKLWESHPFTLSSWKQVENGSGKTHQVISLILKPRDSFTARIRDTVTSKHSKENGTQMVTSQLRIAVEGPYGHHLDLTSYKSVLFVMGGTGITVALSHLCNFYNSFENGTSTALQNIRLVWSVHDRSFYEDVLSHDLRSWLTSTHFTNSVTIEIDVYVTGGSAIPASSTGYIQAKEVLGMSMPTKSEAAITDHESTSSTGHASINFYDHRPSVRDVVIETAERQVGSAGDRRLAVVSCGPPSMADDTRAAVVEVLGRGVRGIDLYPESFTW